jgi:hypothetical protein
MSNHKVTAKKHVAPTVSPNHVGPKEVPSVGFDLRRFGDSKRFVFMKKPTFVPETQQPAYSVGPVTLDNLPR